MQPYRYFAVAREDDQVVASFVEAHLQGEMMAELIHREFCAVLDETRPQAVVLDFGKVNIISTSIVSTFLKIRQECARRSVALKFAGMSETLFGIFKTLNLDHAFPIFNTVEEAKASHVGPVTYDDVVGRPAPLDYEDAD